MMKGWTKRLGRSKSSSSEKNKKSSSGQAQPPPPSAGDAAPAKSPPATGLRSIKSSPLNSAVHGFGRAQDADQQIRPEAFDMNNTGVSSRKAPAQGASAATNAAGVSKRRSSSKDLAAHLQPETHPPEVNRSAKDGLSGELFSSNSAPTKYLDDRTVNDALSQQNFAHLSVDHLAAADYRDGSLRRGKLDRIDGIDTPQRHNSSRLEVSAERKLEQLPGFDEISPQDHIDLFLAKIEQCNVIFNFTDPGSDAMGKEIKRLALCELIEFVSTSEIYEGGQEVYQAVVMMFSKNIIRSIPPPKNPFGDIYDPDDDEPVSVDAWPHMSLVYEFFLRFIDAPDLNVALARQYIDQPFILSLIELFDSEDPRERDYLKTTLHRIYGKFLSSRPFIRRSINNVFLQFIYETGRFNGVAELLEIFGSIINGFAIPLKEEHKIFLRRVLIPLHTARSLGQYHSHLTYCVVQFLEKDPGLTYEVVMGLLRFWPKVSSPKEILFLLELEDIFDVIEPSEFVKVLEPVFTQLAKCIASPHGQVAERALCNWTHEYFANFVAENSEAILPILFPALHENSANWNRTIHGMVHSATKMFLENNPILYEKCAAEFRESQEREKENAQTREQRWNKLEQIGRARLREKQTQGSEMQVDGDTESKTELKTESKTEHVHESGSTSTVSQIFKVPKDAQDPKSSNGDFSEHSQHHQNHQDHHDHHDHQNHQNHQSQQSHQSHHHQGQNPAESAVHDSSKNVSVLTAPLATAVTTHEKPVVAAPAPGGLHNVYNRVEVTTTPVADSTSSGESDFDEAKQELPSSTETTSTQGTSPATPSASSTPSTPVQAAASTPTGTKTKPESGSGSGSGSDIESGPGFDLGTGTGNGTGSGNEIGIQAEAASVALNSSLDGAYKEDEGMSLESSSDAEAEIFEDAPLHASASPVLVSCPPSPES